MFDRPMDGFFGDIDCGPAESVLFQLMTGFCAHELPFGLVVSRQSSVVGP